MSSLFAPEVVTVLVLLLCSLADFKRGIEVRAAEIHSLHSLGTYDQFAGITPEDFEFAFAAPTRVVRYSDGDVGDLLGVSDLRDLYDVLGIDSGSVPDNVLGGIGYDIVAAGLSDPGR